MTWRDLCLILAGFLVRTVIEIISEKTYAWRSERAWHRYVKDREERMLRWKVKLWGIRWEAPKDLETTPRELPRDLELMVTAETEADAYERAVLDASDSYAVAVESVTHTEYEILPERRRPARRDDLE